VRIKVPLIRHDRPVDARRATAVGKDVEASVRCRARSGVDRELVRRVADEIDRCEEGPPLDFIARERLRRRHSLDVARVDARALGIVACIETRIDDDATNDPGES
jgi:hypothetical protein